MKSAINQASIYAALSLGACTINELLERMQIDRATIDRRVLLRFGELLSLMERSGQIVSQTGAESGELRYAVVFGPDRRTAEQQVEAVKDMADNLDRLADNVGLLVDLIGRIVPFWIRREITETDPLAEDEEPK